MWDIYGGYPSGAQTDPHGATSSTFRVLRGGSWGSDTDGCTVSIRDYGGATVVGYFIGFRCVRVSP
ncbi:MAG: hypothetical protein M0Q99_10220 [Candidatus Cloacimonetes bacterium]|nr:hypothetical protein [Candidatus Cloacimonadota bacterium]HPF09097.1 hypothetical protein [Candidatus Cloacimonadota bacterium]